MAAWARSSQRQAAAIMNCFLSLAAATVRGGFPVLSRITRVMVVVISSSAGGGRPVCGWFGGSDDPSSSPGCGPRAFSHHGNVLLDRSSSIWPSTCSNGHQRICSRYLDQLVSGRVRPYQPTRF